MDRELRRKLAVCEAVSPSASAPTSSSASTACAYQTSLDSIPVISAQMRFSSKTCSGIDMNARAISRGDRVAQARNSSGVGMRPMRSTAIRLQISSGAASIGWIPSAWKRDAIARSTRFSACAGANVSFGATGGEVGALLEAPQPPAASAADERAVARSGRRRCTRIPASLTCFSIRENAEARPPRERAPERRALSCTVTPALPSGRAETDVLLEEHLYLVSRRPARSPREEHRCRRSELREGEARRGDRALDRGRCRFGRGRPQRAPRDREGAGLGDHAAHGRRVRVAGRERTEPPPAPDSHSRQGRARRLPAGEQGGLGCPALTARARGQSIVAPRH